MDPALSNFLRTMRAVKVSRNLALRTDRGILQSVGSPNASKTTAKDLIVAELVYKAALAKHREEQTELSRRIVAEAHRQWLEAQRDAMLASWDPTAKPPVTCPRCKRTALALHWANSTPAVATAGKRRRPKGAVPQWAADAVAGGAATVTRYVCAHCNFTLDVLGSVPVRRGTDA